MERMFGVAYMPVGDKDAPKTKVYDGTGLTFTSAAAGTTIIFGTKDIDNQAAYSTSTGVFVCYSDGNFVVDCSVLSTYRNKLHLYKGSTTIASSVVTANAVTNRLSTIEYCNAGTTLHMGYENSGTSTSTITAGKANNWLSVYKLA